jgi:hypothetical protein
MDSRVNPAVRHINRRKDKLTQAVEETQTQSQQPDIPALAAAIEAAKQAAQVAISNTQAAASINDIPGMIRAANVWQLDFEPDMVTLKPGGPIAKAQKAYDRATFFMRDEERQQAVTDILTEGCMYPAEAVTRFLGLKITGYSVTFGEDGRAEVKVSQRAHPSQTGSSGPKGSRARKVYKYAGGVFTSRELLEQYGDSLPAPAILFDIPGRGVVRSADYPEVTGLGSWCIWRTTERNWKSVGAKYNPGYDQYVNKLAEHIGAVREDSN